MYKLITSAEDSDDLSIGFRHCREKRKQELNHNKSKKCKDHLRIMLKMYLVLLNTKKKLHVV